MRLRNEFENSKSLKKLLVWLKNGKINSKFPTQKPVFGINAQAIFPHFTVILLLRMWYDFYHYEIYYFTGNYENDGYKHHNSRRTCIPIIDTRYHLKSQNYGTSGTSGKATSTVIENYFFLKLLENYFIWIVCIHMRY